MLRAFALPGYVRTVVEEALAGAAAKKSRRQAKKKQ